MLSVIHTVSSPYTGIGYDSNISFIQSLNRNSIRKFIPCLYPYSNLIYSYSVRAFYYPYITSPQILTLFTIVTNEQLAASILRTGTWDHTKGMWAHILNLVKVYFHNASSNGSIFRVSGPLCGEFTGHRWIPLTKGQWRGALMFSLICAFNKRLNKQSWGWWFETPSRSLWRHCNVP